MDTGYADPGCCTGNSQDCCEDDCAANGQGCC